MTSRCLVKIISLLLLGVYVSLHRYYQLFQHKHKILNTGLSHSRLAILPGLILSRYSSKVMRTMSSCSAYSKSTTPLSHTKPPPSRGEMGGWDAFGSSFLPPGIPERKNLLSLRYLLANSSVQEMQFEGQLEFELLSSSSHEICKMKTGLTRAWNALDICF